jgi:hypothetical protein
MAELGAEGPDVNDLKEFTHWLNVHACEVWRANGIDPEGGGSYCVLSIEGDLQAGEMSRPNVETNLAFSFSGIGIFRDMIVDFCNRMGIE